MISDEKRAIRYLDTVGYYRLTGYMFHLQKPDGSHQFNDGVDFDDIITHYQFDKKLRYLLLEYIERIEVGLRSMLSNTYSGKHGFFWYTNGDLYENQKVYDQMIINVADYMDQPSEAFLKNFQQKYTSEKYPPSNMMMEFLSMGSLSRVYSALKNDELKQSIATKFELPSNIVASWLIAITNIRNICAHHCRLWNRKLTADRPLIPGRDKYKFPEEIPADFKTSIYGGITLIGRLLTRINPGNSLYKKITNLIDEYPTIDVKEMGFPKGWRTSKNWE